MIFISGKGFGRKGVGDMSRKGLPMGSLTKDAGSGSMEGSEDDTGAKGEASGKGVSISTAGREEAEASSSFSGDKVESVASLEERGDCGGDCGSSGSLVHMKPILSSIFTLSSDSLVCL